MEKSESTRIVFITIGNYDNARHLARIIINEKLAACCNIISNCISVYEWENKMVETFENLLIIKTNDDKMKGLEQRVLELHDYDVPEIISFRSDMVSGPYLKWLNSSLEL